MTVVDGGSKANLITYYNLGEDAAVNYGKDHWLAQTFTLADLYVVWRCRFKSYATIGNKFYEFAIRATDGTGKPTGSDLASTTLSPTGEEEYSPGKWRRFDFGTFPNLPAGLYALIVRVPDATATWHYKLRCDETAPTYAGGKAWRSTDSGASWTEIANTDFMFEVWGWQPPPTGEPDPVIGNWAPIDVVNEPVDFGFKIVVTTDIPVHLFMRWTTTKPLKHPSTQLRRGMLIQLGTRYCFVTWHENEQLEPGDTYTHTFLKLGWEVCTTRYFYFIGTKQAEEMPSASPIFHLHRTHADWEDKMYTFNPVDPERLFAASTVAWNTIDLTNYVRPGATGAICYYRFGTGVGTIKFGYRMNGQVWNKDSRVVTPCQGSFIVGLDADMKFQVRTQSTLDFWIYLIGFTGRNVHFLDEPEDISPILPQTWETKDLSSVAPAATALIGIQAQMPPYVFTRSYVRPNGSTDVIDHGVDTSTFVIKCDDAQKMQVWNWYADIRARTYVTGYIVSGSSFYTNFVQLADPPPGSWFTRIVRRDLAVPIYGIVMYLDMSGICDYGLKKEYGHMNPTLPAKAYQFWPVHCMPGGEIEIFRSTTAGKFYLVGETE